MLNRRNELPALSLEQDCERYRDFTPAMRAAVLAKATCVRLKGRDTDIQAFPLLPTPIYQLRQVIQN
jgi:hypothetical protein